MKRIARGTDLDWVLDRHEDGQSFLDTTMHSFVYAGIHPISYPSLLDSATLLGVHLLVLLYTMSAGDFKCVRYGLPMFLIAE